LFLDSSDQTLVPDVALLSDQNGRFALVVNDKDTVELRRVKIGSLDSGLRVVTEGLSENDRIIVNGLQRARPGVVVKGALKELDPVRTGEAPAGPEGGKPGV
jgi:multidrug efflux system membrane fusion protein